MRGIIVALIVYATGCVEGAQLTLQKPVRSQCSASGLDACDQLTRGTVLYADGKAMEGQQALTSGLQLNAGRPAEIKAFAESIQSLASTSQTNQYTVRLRPVIELLREAAGEQPEQGAATASPEFASAGGPPPPPQADGADSVAVDAGAPEPAARREDSKRTVSGFIGGHADASGKTNIVPCRLGDGTPAWCIFQPVMMRGYVTDLVVSQACERDVFVLEGSPARPTWLVWSGAGRGLSGHDLRLPVQSGGTLVAGVVTKGADPAGQWLWRCGVNWTQTTGR